MAGVTLPWISSPDETLRALDRLHQAESQRRSDGRARLEAIVAGLDVVLDRADDETTPAPQGRRERDARSVPEPDPLPFVALPRRTTHGGEFGPAVREKLTAIALDKESRRW